MYSAETLAKAEAKGLSLEEHPVAPVYTMELDMSEKEKAFVSSLSWERHCPEDCADWMHKIRGHKDAVYRKALPFTVVNGTHLGRSHFQRPPAAQGDYTRVAEIVLNTHFYGWVDIGFGVTGYTIRQDEEDSDYFLITPRHWDKSFRYHKWDHVKAGGYPGY